MRIDIISLILSTISIVLFLILIIYYFTDKKIPPPKAQVPEAPMEFTIMRTDNINYMEDGAKIIMHPNYSPEIPLELTTKDYVDNITAIPGPEGPPGPVGSVKDEVFDSKTLLGVPNSNEPFGNVNQIILSNGLSMIDNKLYTSVSFFDTTDPNIMDPIDRPKEINVLYVSNVNGSLWIWNGNMYISYKETVVRNPGNINVKVSKTMFTIEKDIPISDEVIIDDFNLDVKVGEKVKIVYNLNYQGFSNILFAPLFGFRGVDQDLDFLQASIIGFYNYSTSPSSFSVVYSKNKNYLTTTEGGANLFVDPNNNLDASLIATTMGVERGYGEQAVPVHIEVYYENYSTDTTLQLIFNRDVKTVFDWDANIAGGVMEWVYY